MADPVDDSGDSATNDRVLKRGNYTVKVRVIEARDLAGIGAGGLVSPRVEVIVMGKKMWTAKYDKQLNVLFDEQLWFEFPNAEPAQVNRGKLQLKCWDTSGYVSNALIGATELDLTNIYFADNFELYHQWLALSDTTDTNEGVQGYLKIDVVVLHEDDKYKPHEDDEDDAGEGNEQLVNILNPPNIQIDSKSLSVHIHRLEKLPIMDGGVLGGTCDPFVRVEFSGVEVETKHFTKSLSVDIDEALIIPVMHPCRTRNVIISVWDADLTSNELIATWTYDYNSIADKSNQLQQLEKMLQQTEQQIDQADQDDIKSSYITDPFEDEADRKKKEAERQQVLMRQRDQLKYDIDAKKVKTDAQYVHLYGAPLEPKYNKTDPEHPFMKMNKGFMEGSTYRGTMLLHFSLEDEEDAIKGTEKSEWKNEMNPELVKYGLQCDIYQGAEIPSRNGRFKKFQVKMSICQMTISTKEAYMDPESGLIEWTEILKNDDGQETIEFMFPKDAEQCPDICFYVYADGCLLSYKRLKFEKLLDDTDSWNVAPFWLKMKKEQAANELKEDELPGIILVGLRMGLLKDKPDTISELARPFIGEKSKKSLFGTDELNIPKNLKGNLTLTINELVDYPKAAGGYKKRMEDACRMWLVLKGEKENSNKEEPENTGLTPVIFNNYEDIFKRDVVCAVCKGSIHEDLIDIKLEDKTLDDDKPQELHLEIILWPETSEDLRTLRMLIQAQKGKRIEGQLKERLRKKGRIREMVESKLYFKRKVDENGKETDEYMYDTDIKLEREVWKADPYIWVRCGKKTRKLDIHYNAMYPAKKTDREKNGFVWDEVVEFKNIHVDQTVEITVYEKDMLRSYLIGTARFKVLSLSEQPLGTDFQDVTKRYFVKTSKAIDLREEKRLEQLRKKERERMEESGYVDEDYLDEIIDEEEKYCKIIVKGSFQHNESLAVQNDVPRVGITNPNPALFKSHVNESQKTNLAQLGRPQLVQQRMVVYIYQALDLEGKDDNGLSDPYVVIRYAGDKIQSQKKPKNVNPQWMERRSILISIPRQHEFAPDIQVTVYDSDADEYLSWSDDVLGRFSIPYQEAMEMTQPEWFELKDDRGTVCGGKVYLFIEFQDPLEDDTDYAFPIKQKKDRYYMHIFTLGVRHLQGGALIKKAQITYYDHEGTTWPQDDPTALISADPTPTNANFRALTKIETLLPKDPQLAPSWSISVNNISLANFKSLIGTATVHIKDYMSLTPDGSWEPKLINAGILDEKKLENELVEEEIAEEVTDIGPMLHAEFLARKRAEMWADNWIVNENKDISREWEQAQYEADQYWVKLKEHEREISIGKKDFNTPFRVKREYTGYGEIQNDIYKRIKEDCKARKKEIMGDSYRDEDDEDDEGEAIDADDMKAMKQKKKKKGGFFSTEVKDNRLTLSVAKDKMTDQQRELEDERRKFEENKRKQEKEFEKKRKKRAGLKLNNAQFNQLDDELDDYSDESGKDYKNEEEKILADQKETLQDIISAKAGSDEGEISIYQEQASKLFIEDKNRDGVVSQRERKDVKDVKTDLAIVSNQHGSETERREALKRIGAKLETPETLEKKRQEAEEYDDEDSDEGAALLEEKIEQEPEKVQLSRREKKKQERRRRKQLQESTQSWLTTGDENEFDMNASVNRKALEENALSYMYGRKELHKSVVLEDYYDCHPFQVFPLWTGQKGGSSFFNNNRRTVGNVKGLWKLSKTKEDGLKDELKQLLEPRGLVVQIYILKAELEVAMDSDLTNDPYVVIKLGDQQYSSRARYLENTMEPLFHEATEFKVKLPGPSQLIIEVWDFDGIGDDLIGICEVDIEDRWFSKTWRKLKSPRPCEWKALHHPKSKQPFGRLQFWLDMWTMNEARTNPLVEISLPPVEPWELRIVVWDAKNCAIKDEITNMNDLYVTIQPNLPKTVKNPKAMVRKQSTDTHFRAKGGRGSFRWRCKWDLELGEQTFLNENPIHVTFAAFDQDFLSSNDLIGVYKVDMRNFFLFAFRKKDKVTLTQKRRHWITQQMVTTKKLEFTEFYHPDYKEDNRPVSQATIYFTVQLMPKSIAEELPASLGRGEPNMFPYLPEPVGRFQWSLNPLSIMRQLLGDALCFQICSCVFGVLCVSMLVMTGPMIVTNFIVGMLSG